MSQRTIHGCLCYLKIDSYSCNGLPSLQAKLCSFCVCVHRDSVHMSMFWVGGEGKHRQKKKFKLMLHHVNLLDRA